MRTQRRRDDPQIMLTDPRMAELPADLKAMEAKVEDHRGQALSYAGRIAAVANEWDLSIRVAREFLSNWLARERRNRQSRKTAVHGRPQERLRGASGRPATSTPARPPQSQLRGARTPPRACEWLDAQAGTKVVEDSI